MSIGVVSQKRCAAISYTTFISVVSSCPADKADGAVVMRMPKHACCGSSRISQLFVCRSMLNLKD